uniref:PX domain-containing protein n=1 Tax=Oryzias sinensis TaxID=183150 RepID=A0A8C7XSD6_9TELE
MASPFVPVPVPMDRTLSGGRSKSRRPQRAASLGSVSSSSESSSPVARTTIKEQDSRFQSSCTDGTPPPPVQSPVTRARMNGALEPCVEFSNCPHSACGSAGSQEAEERPITPTVLGYEVMEERAKFTVYKILVRKNPDQSWVIFRRYADFSRLNDKVSCDGPRVDAAARALQGHLKFSPPPPVFRLFICRLLSACLPSFLKGTWQIRAAQRSWLFINSLSQAGDRLFRI